MRFAEKESSPGSFTAMLTTDFPELFESESA